MNELEVVKIVNSVLKNGKMYSSFNPINFVYNFKIVFDNIEKEFTFSVPYMSLKQYDSKEVAHWILTELRDNILAEYIV